MAKKRVQGAEKSAFAKKLLGLSARYHTWEVWSDFIVMFACAISNSVDKAHAEEREAMYAKIIEKYNEKAYGFP